MAKYCVKCGKALPDGVEICPECNAAAAQEKEAALFTHMTPDAEVWKTAEPVKERRKAKKSRTAQRTAFFKMRTTFSLYKLRQRSCPGWK